MRAVSSYSPKAKILTPTFEPYRARAAARVDRALARLVRPRAGVPARLQRAMSYSLLGPGKRLRPVLVVLAHETLGGAHPGVWGAACAVEMAHAFSLVHDDLPCMDDDDYRRGRLTVHRKFGEAVALLAGDALLSEAFGILARSGGDGAGSEGADLVSELADAVGPGGMVAGQVLDILAENRRTTAEGVRRIHRLKTAALIRVSVRIGARLARGSAADARVVSELGESLGLAFQAGDDLLNATSTRKSLGKAAGSDAKRGKATLPRVLGIGRSRAELARLCNRARRLAARLPAKAEVWEDLIHFVEFRRS